MNETGFPRFFQAKQNLLSLSTARFCVLKLPSLSGFSPSCIAITRTAEELLLILNAKRVFSIFDVGRQEQYEQQEGS